MRLSGARAGSRPLAATLALLAAVALSSCGGTPPDGRLGFDLYVSQAVLDEVGAFQFALLPDADRYTCAKVTARCLSEAVTASELIPLQDADGVEHPALVFPAELLGPSDGGTQTQDVLLRGVPVGGDYQLVIEALSKANPPTLLGSTCHRVVEVRQGENPRVTPNPIQLGVPDGGGCDPRFER